MIGKLFRSQKANRPERPTFRPMLESLEDRQVPNAAFTGAAYHALPGDVNNLEANLAVRPPDPNTVQASIDAVRTDVFTLVLGVNAFEYRSQLAIDNSLVVNGLRLINDGFNNLPFIAAPQFVQIENIGFEAVEHGAINSVVIGFFPQTVGDAILR